MPITLPLNIARRKLAEGEALLTRMEKDGAAYERVVRAVTSLRKAIEQATSAPLTNARGATDAGGGTGNRPCWACGGETWWVSIYGRTVCIRCHPPAMTSLVSKVIGITQ